MADPGDHAHGEVDAENPYPEAGRVVPVLPVPRETPRLHEHDQEGQPHRELGEQVVIDDGERELEPVKHERITHFADSLSRTLVFLSVCPFSPKHSSSAAACKVSSSSPTMSAVVTSTLVACLHAPSHRFRAAASASTELRIREESGAPAEPGGT